MPLKMGSCKYFFSFKDVVKLKRFWKLESVFTIAISLYNLRNSRRWNHCHEYVFAMLVMDNPNATREYRLWFHAHGRRIIGNPEHRQDQGYIQTAASLNDTMHSLSQMNLGMEEAGDDPQRQSD
ncbi:PREDICTED: uncharacterized protein LOC109176337 isoform X2 [Ipomoea nil]|uniref:uncharacterized protein LOC109176337 isoform X2 n=1 Tax=Ipomoea nil TaxID=35883 RepID=UPI000901FC69|nr:PREDICTED: uncharacterized protein LOC109176337 isoform X2 [Ipomoea nil]